MEDITNSKDDTDTSCIIVEEQAEVIEINDTFDDLELTINGGNGEDPDSQPELENETLGDYEVIDETGCTINLDDSTAENGLSNPTSKDPVSHFKDHLFFQKSLSLNSKINLMSI